YRGALTPSRSSDSGSPFGRQIAASAPNRPPVCRSTRLPDPWTLGADLRDGDSHCPRSLPIVLAGHGGGRLSTGRPIVYPKDSPLWNLYLMMLDESGTLVEWFADSTYVGIESRPISCAPKLNTSRHQREECPLDVNDRH